MQTRKTAADRLADADVAVARIGATRNDAERHEYRRARSSACRPSDVRSERPGIGHVVGGRQHGQHGVGVLGRDALGRPRTGHGRIAASGLDQHPRGRQAAGPTGGAGLLVATHDPDAVTPHTAARSREGGVEQRLAPDDPEELLRAIAPRSGPEALAGPARQHDGVQRRAALGAHRPTLT